MTCYIDYGIFIHVLKTWWKKNKSTISSSLWHIQEFIYNLWRIIHFILFNLLVVRLEISADDHFYGEKMFFSWDEMAKYDIPAVIEYILKKTGKQQLYFIGHSQGTLQAFAAFSQNATLAKKVCIFYSWCNIFHFGESCFVFTV